MATLIPNSSSKTITLKLLKNNNSNKVVFPEAGKEFVDFLFGLLQISLGSIMGFLWNYGMAAGPKPAFSSATHTPQLLLDFVSLDQKTRTEAHDTNKFSSFSPPSFSSPFSSGSSWNEVVAQHKEIGYVRGVVTYMVMDDLMVKPMSTISSISHLNDLEIKDIRLGAVKASFDCTTVLTDVFLGNKVKASMENGVLLTVTVPKEEDEKKPEAKAIEISG
uniref:SHSP domain-containing protein n=1 Tax=Fagus sylvatica TaxID=28930 RepID=A0A2N9ECT6_FAGSY